MVLTFGFYIKLPPPLIQEKGLGVHLQRGKVPNFCHLFFDGIAKVSGLGSPTSKRLTYSSPSTTKVLILIRCAAAKKVGGSTVGG